MVKLSDNSPMGLIDALCERIGKVLADSFWYPSEFSDEEFHSPHVHAQYLPVSLTESEERDKSKDFPLVQVVCTEGQIIDFDPIANESGIKLEIYFGGYRNDPDNQGWRIPMAMLWRVLQDLLADTIIGAYQFDAPVKWTPLNYREPPYYTAKLETIWKGRPPAIEVPAVL